MVVSAGKRATKGRIILPIKTRSLSEILRKVYLFLFISGDTNGLLYILDDVNPLLILARASNKMSRNNGMTATIAATEVYVNPDVYDKDIRNC